MKQITHKINNDYFEGSVDLTVPSYKERLTILKELSFDVKDGAADASKDHYDRAIKSVDKLNELVKKVDLKVKKTGDVITSIDELGFYKEGQEVIGQLSYYIMRGIQLGNDLPAS